MIDEVILQVAGTRACDLLVMSSARLGEAKLVLLGSVREWGLHHSIVPILMLG